MALFRDIGLRPEFSNTVLQKRSPLKCGSRTSMIQVDKNTCRARKLTFNTFSGKVSFSAERTELEIWQVVLGRQLREDRREVDARGAPGREEGHQPSDVRVSLKLVFETVGPEVDNVFWTLVGWLGEKQALKFRRNLSFPGRVRTRNLSYFFAVRGVLTRSEC